MPDMGGPPGSCRVRCRCRSGGDIGTTAGAVRRERPARRGTRPPNGRVWAVDDREDDTSTTARLAETEKALRRAGREMKWWQIELEHTAESLQRGRRQRARLREQAEFLSDALATSLSSHYWESRPSSAGVSRLLGRSRTTADPEA